MFLCEFFVSLFGGLPLEDGLRLLAQNLFHGGGKLLLVVGNELLESDYAAVKSENKNKFFFLNHCILNIL